MKQFNVILVQADKTDVMEKVLNRFRIGLNDWDRTRAFNYYGVYYVNYTILCTADMFANIEHAMSRV